MQAQKYREKLAAEMEQKLNRLVEEEIRKIEKAKLKIESKYDETWDAQKGSEMIDLLEKQIKDLEGQLKFIEEEKQVEKEAKE